MAKKNTHLFWLRVFCSNYYIAAVSVDKTFSKDGSFDNTRNRFEMARLGSVSPLSYF